MEILNLHFLNREKSQCVERSTFLILPTPLTLDNSSYWRILITLMSDHYIFISLSTSFSGVSLSHFSFGIHIYQLLSSFNTLSYIRVCYHSLFFVENHEYCNWTVCQIFFSYQTRSMKKWRCYLIVSEW